MTLKDIIEANDRLTNALAAHNIPIKYIGNQVIVLYLFPQSCIIRAADATTAVNEETERERTADLWTWPNAGAVVDIFYRKKRSKNYRILLTKWR